ncbi:GNAT family N-acetyltransferase [Halopenitus persicus]|uniref:Phosphinothricin acetyltransferase n=1 Tax=Halopenitus persicus TaxID=1048396 RepID=A0A1H3EF05_9EURY|nr:GNAT family N-acetyltransferase [Halopenitus persicus]SDX77312.1 phosphinothricin acetyltransferase [Halopenitus persicus]
MARRVRVATPEDAQAIRDIYAPFVEETAIAFRTDPPTTAAVADDIETTTETYPWLVVERIDEGSDPGSGSGTAPEPGSGTALEPGSGTALEPGSGTALEPGSGTVIGYAAANRLRGTGAYRWTVEPSVYVADGHRGSGVGSTLYAALLRVLRAQGFVNVYAVTTLPNPASVALHERFDFDPVGTFPAVGYKHGEWHDVRWWHRTLGDRPADPDPPVPFADLVGTAELRARLDPDGATGATGPTGSDDAIDSDGSTDQDDNP